ncbi:hypothetical protein QVD17_12240 [Tagetes erecta]|uniref:Uncharacterized protein n=1 Tax=Tagetes erecta TaxID=13708 RepID=A0AAD8KVH5_TARER|nr:hypothetical protein QVD17_12240 [Tagetes erecta]
MMAWVFVVKVYTLPSHNHLSLLEGETTGYIGRSIGFGIPPLMISRSDRVDMLGNITSSLTYGLVDVSKPSISIVRNDKLRMSSYHDGFNFFAASFMPGSEHTSNGWIEEDIKPDVSALSHVGPTITPPSPFVTRELLPLPPTLFDRPTPVIRHVYTRQRKRKAKVVLSDMKG